jgi:hypothetical protein
MRVGGKQSCNISIMKVQDSATRCRTNLLLVAFSPTYMIPSRTNSVQTQNYSVHLVAVVARCRCSVVTFVVQSKAAIVM